jgi:RNA polymerase sigma-70 factor (ECF subfamily)
VQEALLDAAQVIALRLDRRLAARVDPSDVVQEALLDAAQGLSDYLRERPLPFYPWLRQRAWDRLIEQHRRPLLALRRSVKREEPPAPHLSDESAMQLADRVLTAVEGGGAAGAARGSTSLRRGMSCGWTDPAEFSLRKK